MKTGLCDAHDGPWTLDDDDAPGSEGPGAMGIVEDLSLGEVSRETPFTKLSHFVWVDPASTVSQGIALQIMESDGNGVF